MRRHVHGLQSGSVSRAGRLSFCGGSRHSTSLRQTLTADIVNTYSIARSGNGVNSNSLLHPVQGGYVTSATSVRLPSGRALHPGVPPDFEGYLLRSGVTSRVGRASELQRSFQPEGRQHRKAMKSCATRRRQPNGHAQAMNPIGLHSSATSFFGQPEATLSLVEETASLPVATFG